MSKLEEVAALVGAVGKQAREVAGMLDNYVHGMVRMQDAVADAGRRGAGVQVVSGQLASAVQSVRAAAAATGNVEQLAAQLAQFLVGSSGSGIIAGASIDQMAATPGSGTASQGMAELDVNAADLADTPILGEFGRGGLSRDDYRWAVQTWHDTVGPGVEAGMTRDEFAARDLAGGAPALRRSADVYDMFLGSDRIRVDRRPDGSLNIINGRHRFAVARELGIASLPGEVSG